MKGSHLSSSTASHSLQFKSQMNLQAPGTHHSDHQVLSDTWREEDMSGCILTI